MNDNLTEIVCILDRSGSMASIAGDTIGGFNAFVQKQKELEGEARLTLVLFDDNYEIPIDGVDIQDVEELTSDTYFARGMTGLYDALGRSIDTVGARLATTEESDRPGKVIVLVMTDGHENSSKEYNLARIREMVTHQQDVYSWEFVFIGANIDSFAAGDQIGLSAGSTTNYVASAAGTQEAFGKLTRSVVQYRTTGVKGDVDADLDPADALDDSTN